jgi:hypothetical protein
MGVQDTEVDRVMAVEERLIQHQRLGDMGSLLDIVRAGQMKTLERRLLRWVKVCFIYEYNHSRLKNYPIYMLFYRLTILLKKEGRRA